MLAVAEHLDTVNLPADRNVVVQILDRSEKSFAETVPPVEREYLFVLEDLAKRRIIGTSIIYAQHGTRRAPHIFFRVEQDERYSYTLDRYFVHQTLRIGYNYEGPTEIGGLILLPEYRRNPEALGRLLSYVRFVFMRMHRPVFRDSVLSELLPPLEPDGASLLWEHLGRRFTGLSYQEADRLSKDNKEFIHALFPDEPIHTELLPSEVRAAIGEVGPESKGVEKMLLRLGFEYARQIDPFDGGPHFVAKTDSISVVRDAGIFRVDTSSAPSGIEWSRAVLAVQRQHERPGFRACGAMVPTANGVVHVTRDVCEKLAVQAGDAIWVAPG